MSTPRFITTSTGVRIGCAYQPPAPRPSRDHERIQAALLEPRTARPLAGWRALFGFFWRTC